MNTLASRRPGAQSRGFWFFGFVLLCFAYLSLQREVSNAGPGKLVSASSSSFQRVAPCVIGLLVLIIATIMGRLAPCFKYTISCNSHSRSRKWLLLWPRVLDRAAEAPNTEGLFTSGPRADTPRKVTPGSLFFAIFLQLKCCLSRGFSERGSFHQSLSSNGFSRSPPPPPRPVMFLFRTKESDLLQDLKSHTPSFPST